MLLGPLLTERKMQETDEVKLDAIRPEKLRELWTIGSGNLDVKNGGFDSESLLSPQSPKTSKSASAVAAAVAAAAAAAASLSPKTREAASSAAAASPSLKTREAASSAAAASLSPRTPEAASFAASQITSSPRSTPSAGVTPKHTNEKAAAIAEAHRSRVIAEANAYVEAEFSKAEAHAQKMHVSTLSSSLSSVATSIRSAPFILRE